MNHWFPINLHLSYQLFFFQRFIPLALFLVAITSAPSCSSAPPLHHFPEVAEAMPASSLGTLIASYESTPWDTGFVDLDRRLMFEQKKNLHDESEFRAWVWIATIDGVPGMYYFPLVIAPGEHTIKMVFEANGGKWRSPTMYIDTTVDVAAGMTYRLDPIVSYDGSGILAEVRFVHDGADAP